MHRDSSSKTTPLLAMAVSGNAAALGSLLEHHRSYLKMLASAKIHQSLQGKVDASDVVQETCVEALRMISTFRGSSPAEFAGWLRGILANRMSKIVRRYLGTQQRNVQMELSMRRELDEASGQFAQYAAATSNSPSEVLEWNETVLELAQAIESLPADYQQVVLLRNIQGLPFREIAIQMERSLDSVEKLWVRALTKLKERIQSI
jgi:RNA polymerase sigma-70 factor (ECF subfamily)